jgi:predicted metal-dependent hydrolase
MYSIRYGDRRIDYEIKRGKRKKTVAIQVAPSSTVSVFTPQFLREEKIRLIVQRKARWIAEKQDLMRRNRHLYAPKEFVSGESFPYLGRQYRLQITSSPDEGGGGCRLIRGRLQVEVDPGTEDEGRKRAAREALIGWYRTRAEDKIRERAARFLEQIEKGPESIEIKDQKRRWGSCSHRGTLRFNWKLILAPLSLLDYVVLHELCHLKHPYHSAPFWRAVQAIIPDYQARRDRLREFTLIAESIG